MRIHQLPMGARFEYEGKEYEKTGPMLASSAGATRLIPKYAELRAIGEYAPVSSQPDAKLSRAEVMQAFAAFYETCSGLVPTTEAATLEAARENFLQALKLSRGARS